MKSFMQVIMLVACSVLMYTCQQTAKQPATASNQAATEAHATETAAATVLYGCPSHKELIGAKGDICIKCGTMKMIPITWSLEGIDTVRVTSLPEYKKQ